MEHIKIDLTNVLRLSLLITKELIKPKIKKIKS